MASIDPNSTLFLLNELIASRRAVYPTQYTGEMIDDDLIRIILNNAKWAPTHRKTEPWFFHVFSGSKLRILSDYMSMWYKQHTTTEDFSLLKYEKTKQKALKSSHVIAICMKRDPDERLPEWEEIAAVACAVQNMWLTCTAMNIGCYWSTPDSAINAGSFLGLKDGERCLGWFYIGRPRPDIVLQGVRSDITSKTVWHT